MTDPPYVAMVLLNNTSLGGAERRFAQVYEGLRARKVPIALVINESLLAGLRQGGLLQPEGELGLVVKERVGRLKSSLAFSLRKLDYLFACVSVGCWLRRSRPQVVHLVGPPEEVRRRTDKMGFVTPEDEWLKVIWRPQIEATLESDSLRSRPYWRAAVLQEWYGRYRDGRVSIGPTVWRWVNLEWWLRRFCD